MSPPRHPLTERPGRAAPGKVLLSLGLAVALVTALNFGASRWLVDHTSNRGYWLINKKWRLLLDRDEPVDWLILGDSTCNQSMRPDVIAKLTGKRALNLCIFGNLLVLNPAWMLEVYLKRHPPPEAVVLGFSYDQWHRHRIHPGLWAKLPLEWRYWEKLDPPIKLDEKLQRQMFLGRYLALYAQSTTLAKWARDPGTIPFGDAFEITADGYMPRHAPDPKHLRRDIRAHRRFLRRARFKISRINRQALERILQLSDERGFDVYLAATPLSEVIAGEKAFQKYYADLLAALDPIFKAHPRAHLAPRQPVTFPADQLENCDHVVHEAAAEYTRRLVEAIEAVSQ